ncbi:MAG: AAA family ATPase [Herminiimonas sp.]|nr:AAA family ATPase [Herminiimonas sp.]
MKPWTDTSKTSVMMSLPGYSVDCLLYESRQSCIYRGKRAVDNVSVIFKVLSEDFPSPEKRARFQQEYNLMRKLKSDAVLRAYSMESHQGIQVMVLEDFGGTSLNKLDINAGLSMVEWLKVAVRLAECLDQLHQHHIMHKDINPANIVWNRKSGEIKLIDLGIATELSREVPEIRNPDRLEGTLAYLSPEQTGRMNRSMDYRTDFYSLGATFYELLTGALPFASGDALELVHSHIARQPIPVEQLRPLIPPMISAIVTKLMGKTAEERYQSAAGLKLDLATCLHTLDADGCIPMFALGQTDFSQRLQISQKLYGRETQIATLLDTFERARTGPAELLLVAGYSGIGKSALVHEIRKPITRDRGYFIEGKFDQFKRDIPYASLSQAFRELIQQVLTEGEEIVAQWRSKLLQALGNNAQVIIDVIPNLEMIIGPQPPILDLPAAQEHTRFNHEFRKFVGTFASVDHPLVIFFDDLQWADLPSLHLMSLLLRAPALPHLLLIGAYRDNEVAAMHSLPVTLKEMEKYGATVQTIALPPLDLDQVSDLLCDTLRATPARVRELAYLSLAKTQGNPFFLNQFLGALVDHKMLFLDVAKGGWSWDVDKVQQAGITDNIVELMVARLGQLPIPTQRVLQGAACLGNVFDLKMLAVVCELAETDTARLLWDALQEELIVPLDDHYKYVGQAGSDHEVVLLPTYRFLHDRVQQAAYLLSSASEKAAMHLAIGRLWLQTYSPFQQQSLLFDLVNHFNQGRGLITDPTERHQLAQLNLTAARRAKASAAYKPALVYLEVALELVTDADWQSRYDLMFALHLDAGEAAHLNHDFARMEHIIALALPQARNLLDQAKIYEIRIQAYITQDKYHEVVSSGLEVLRLLGVYFPKKPNKMHVLLSLARTRLALAGRRIDQLALLPDATDPRILAARKILTKIISAAYYALPRHFPLLQLKAIRLSLKYGHAAPSSAADFAMYSLILGGVLGDIKQAAKYGELGLRLQERPGMEMYKSRTMFIVHAGIHPWSRSMHATLEPLTQGYLCGVEVGDVEFSANAAMMYCFHAFYCGNELAGLEREAANYLSVLVWPGRRSDLTMLSEQLRMLMGQSPAQLVQQEAAHGPQPGIDVDAGKGHAAASQHSKPTAFQSSSTKLMVAYLFRDYKGALDHASRARKYVATPVGFIGVAVFYFYWSLLQLALLKTTPQSGRGAVIKKIHRNQKKLAHWAKHAPANFLHKWHLVEAGLAQHDNRPLIAIRGYETAIRLARENNFLHEEALAKELAGEYYLAQGMDSLARFYLGEAQQGYRRWGAIGKVQDLADRYPNWLRDHGMVSSTFTGGTETVSMTSASTSGILDFATAMKASQALSQEIVLERLLKRLMQVVIESAGAQRGLLLLKRDADWFVEAEKRDDQLEATVLQSVMLDESVPEEAPLPLALVHYVARARESILVHEARDETLLANDRYVQKHAPRSVLMMPILHHGELTGILYLENNAVSGAFTENRLEVLQLLASQAAISIENAQLYADMEQRVALRTAELKAMSLRDGLTGVSNRRAFDERLKEELARSRRTGHPLSLLIIDIDHFKLVNDTYGHPVGDACLKLMGTVLTAECRRAADFVARYGGEEFALLLPDTDIEHATRFAELVRSAIQKIVLEIGHIRHPITASIGVAEAAGALIIDGASLIASADRCLYAAKAGGRNRVMHAQPAEHLGR